MIRVPVPAHHADLIDETLLADPVRHFADPADHLLVAASFRMQGGEHRMSRKASEAARLGRLRQSRLALRLFLVVTARAGIEQCEALHPLRRPQRNLTRDEPAHREADEGKPLRRLRENPLRHRLEAPVPRQVAEMKRAQTLEPRTGEVPEMGVAHEAGQEKNVGH
jgi:hypothetical protein